MSLRELTALIEKTGFHPVLEPLSIATRLDTPEPVTFTSPSASGSQSAETSDPGSASTVARSHGEDGTVDAEPKLEGGVPRVLGSYRVLQRIGEGAMGLVFVAEHQILKRQVAIKVLRQHLTASRPALRRFFNEARALAAIRHPGIVEVIDLQETPDGLAYIVMELLEGETLSSLLRRAAPLDLLRGLRVAIQALEALEAAHSSGIVHRDLKPDNIFVMPGVTGEPVDRVKLVDFGVAKLHPGLDSGEKTAAFALIGTPRYMSPEAARGNQTIDARSDVYSLGVILYEVFTGVPLFRGADAGEYIVKHISEQPTPPRDLTSAPRLPAKLEEIIMRCLAKRPEDRYSSASSVLEDLRQLRDRLERDSTLTWARPFLGRRLLRQVKERASLVASLAALVLATAGLAIAWHPWQSASVASTFDAPPARPQLGDPEEARVPPVVNGIDSSTDVESSGAKPRSRTRVSQKEEPGLLLDLAVKPKSSVSQAPYEDRHRRRRMELSTRKHDPLLLRDPGAAVMRRLEGVAQKATP